MHLEEIESIVLGVLKKLPPGKHPVVIIPDLFPPLEKEINREDFEAALKSLEEKGKVKKYDKLSKTEKTVSLTTIDEVLGTDFAYHDAYVDQDLTGVELVEE